MNPASNTTRRKLRKVKRMMIDEGPAMLVHKINDQLADFLKEREGLFSRNAGEFFDLKITRDYIENSLMRGRSLSPEVIAKLHNEMLTLAVSMAIHRMAQSSGRMVDELRLPEATRRIVARDASLHEMYEYCCPAKATDKSMASMAEHVSLELAA